MPEGQQASDQEDFQRLVLDSVSAFLLLGTAVLGAYLPRVLSAHIHSSQAGEQRKRACSAAFHLGNMLSGGVMLSAGFCHLLGEAISSQYQQHCPDKNTRQFPLATFLAACGYITTLLADQFVQHVTEDSSPRKQHLHMNGTIPEEREACLPTINEPSSEIVLKDENARVIPLRELIHNSPESARTPRKHADLADDSHDHHHKVFTGHRQLSFATTVLLAIALCIHSILEGMAQGSQKTLANSEQILVAIIAHKGLAAYALGASLMESKTTVAKFWSVVFMFAFATPLGIFLGYWITADSSSASSGAALSSLASGTFMYVAMMEVIPKELADSKHRLSKMFMLLLGFGLMSLLAIWA